MSASTRTVKGRKGMDAMLLVKIVVAVTILILMYLFIRKYVIQAGADSLGPIKGLFGS